MDVGNFQKKSFLHRKLLKNNCAEGPWKNIKQELSTIHAGHVFNDEKKILAPTKDTQSEGEQKQNKHVPDKN